MVYWQDSARYIYVARVYGVTGPRGGRVTLWGVYQGTRLLATESTLKAACGAARFLLNTRALEVTP